MQRFKRTSKKDSVDATCDSGASRMIRSISITFHSDPSVRTDHCKSLRNSACEIDNIFRLNLDKNTLPTLGEQQEIAKPATMKRKCKSIRERLGFVRRVKSEEEPSKKEDAACLTTVCSSIASNDESSSSSANNTKDTPFELIQENVPCEKNTENLALTNGKQTEMFVSRKNGSQMPKIRPKSDFFNQPINTTLHRSQSRYSTLEVINYNKCLLSRVLNNFLNYTK